MNRAAAEQLRAEVAAAVGDLATATLSPTEAANRLGAGGAVVVIVPPRLEFPTMGHTTAEWELIVASGPSTDYLRAWDTLSAVVGALREPFGLETAEPNGFEAQGGRTYPAYVVRTTYTYDND